MTQKRRLSATVWAAIIIAVGGIMAAVIGAIISGLLSKPHASQNAAKLPENGILIQIESQMFVVPAGNFLRGSNRSEIEQFINTHPDWRAGWFENELPQRIVYLDAFYISKYEVTNELYNKFLDDNPGYERPAYWHVPDFNGKNQPVVGVNWNDAIAYCNWLSEKTNKKYRLPTEAEWEKAARGTDGRIYPWGNSEPDIQKANFMDQNHKTVSVRNNPLGASPFGLMHMAGNVWEWCSDWYDEDYYSIKEKLNPTGPLEGTKKVVRGGSWRENSFFLRCAARNRYPPKTKNEFIGFRVVRVPKS